MLEQILIRQFALIDEMVLPFYGGLTALSGETGAGKSIVVDAVSAVLGGKTDKTMVRSGAQKAYVEGTFSLSGNRSALQFLKEQELESEDERVVLSREISASGRNVCRINGILVNLSVLKTLASLLMEIHGQNEHQALLFEENHLRFLDALGDDTYQKTLVALRDLYQEYTRARRAYEEAVQDIEYRQIRLEKLEYEYKEIEKAHLQDGEEEELSLRRDRLRYADKISRGLKAVYNALMDGEAGESDALSLIKKASDGIKGIVAYHSEYAEIDRRLDSVYYELEDIALTAHKQEEGLSMDDETLEEIENRLDTIRRLEKKYGVSIKEVLAHFETVSNEIQRLNGLENQIDDLRNNEQAALEQYKQLAKKMTKLRHDLSKITEQKIDTELSALNMKAARFLVEMDTELDRISETGSDRVRFLIAPNVGEDPKPLSKTASGGELSRIMLAIKAASAEKNMVPTMVFDEVDTGISGKTAAVVAEKMWSIAKSRQVICVTHLQQIAAMASSHMLVRKYESEGRTLTEAIYLKEDERIEEIARLIGGTRDNNASGYQHAASLLKDAARFRRQAP